MKKIPLLGFTILLLGIVVNPMDIHAASGACSSHSGVNCSAGADFDGSVICNDGWHDSSVAYSSMQSCKMVSSPQCTSPYGYGCTTQSDLDSLKKSISSMQAITGMTGSPLDPSQQNEISQCEDQIQSYAKQTAAYDKCMISNYSYSPETNSTVAPKSSSDDTEAKEHADTMKRLEQLASDTKQKNLACQSALGVANFNFDKQKCECAEHTVLKDNKCVLGLETTASNTSVENQTTQTPSAKLPSPSGSMPVADKYQQVEKSIDTSTTTSDVATSGAPVNSGPVIVERKSVITNLFQWIKNLFK